MYAIGRGYEFYDILNIRERCNLKDLSFLDSECSTLQGLELAAAIRSSTIAIDELLNNFDNLKSIKIKNKSKEAILLSFKTAAVNYNIQWNNEENDLFSFVKTLVYVMSDALANNNIFLFVNYQY